MVGCVSLSSVEKNFTQMFVFSFEYSGWGFDTHVAPV